MISYLSGPHCSDSEMALGRRPRHRRHARQRHVCMCACAHARHEDVIAGNYTITEGARMNETECPRTTETSD